MNTQDFHNWCKLEFLTARGSGLIRDEFKKRWHNKCNKIWDSSCAAEFCNGIGLKVYEAAYKDQQKLLKQGDVDKWDLTLLRSIFDTSIFGKKQEIKDFNAKVRKLAEIRNTLAHHSSKNISNADFDLYWEKVSNILVDMGDSKDELDELKCSLKSQQIIHIRNENIQKANQLKLEGNKHYGAKEYSKAISSYTEAIVLPGIPEHDLAVLYSNRSASYLERHLHNKTNSDDIKSARKDAKNSKNLNPEWYKAYLRLGRAYEALNKLDNAIKAFHKALILEPNNEELKNAHANAIRNKGAQDRYEHLDSGINGISTEQVLQDFQARTGQNMKLEDLEKLNKVAKRLNPVLEDVWKGHQYRDGDGVKQDYAMAAKYYGLAVNKNNAEAMYNLAMLHQRGLGVKQDYGIAFSLLQRATEQPAIDPFFNGPTVGVAEAEHSLGNHYLEGIYVKKDELVAASWFERAIEHGYGRSANNLGLMYMKGQGVSQDLKRAEQLFLFAASHEDKNALDNLVVLYCELENPEKALEWNKKAIEKGSMVARSMQRELESMIPQFKKDLDKSGVVEWEKANNLCSDNLSIKERIDRRLAFENPQAKTLVENVQRIQAQMMTPKTGVTTSNKMFKYDITELEMYSHKSVIAKKMHEAMSHFLLSFDLLMNISENISFDNDLCKDFVKHLAQCFRLEHIVATFPVSEIQVVKSIVDAIISHIHSLMKKKNVDQDPNQHKALLELDQDARLCFAVLNLGSPKLLIEFLSDSMKKYPHNKVFLRFRGNAFSFEQRYEDALRDYNRLLEMEPENYEFLYFKAVSLRIMGLSTAIKAYEEYISKAPVDERKRPEAYYAMGTCTIVASKELEKSGKKTNQEKIFKDLKKYYELGLEAEKKQLPFFLPYESNSRMVLEVWVKPEKLLEKKEQASSTEQTKLKDPARKELIIQHRQSINNFKKTIPKGFSGIRTTTNPPKQQKLPTSLIGLKPAYINEIDFTKDHVLSGYVLEVTSIDIPLRTGMSIMLVVEDKNNNVQRAALYNFDENLSSIGELGIGSKLSIINPYIRMAQDGKPLIRVDDPSSVIFGGKTVDMCAYCGNLSASSACGGCKTTKYCSKECQVSDWKEFQHKLICITNTK